MSVNLLYNIANYYVIPFWIMIVLFPNWEISRKVMKSSLLFLPLIMIFLYLLSQSVTPESASNLFFVPLENIVLFFRGEEIISLTWVQLLTLDLFVGRWIYWEGQRTGIFTAHSIILSYFGGGPSGILSHMITVLINTTINSNIFSSPSSTEKNKS